MAKEAEVIAKETLRRLCCWLDRNDVATLHGNGKEHEEIEISNASICNILAMCCEVMSSFVIFAVLDLRVCGCRP